MKLFKICLFLVCALFISAGISSAAKFHKLKSKKVSKGPKIDGKAKDKVWKKAKSLTMEAEDGPEVSVKSIHTDKEIFFLIEWEDKDASLNQGAWESDGKKWSLKQEIRFEGEPAWEADSDRVAFQWPIKSSVDNFGLKGCKLICHAPEKEDKMYTNVPKERTDIWHWVSTTTNPAGYADDQYLDNANLTKKQEKDSDKRINIAHHGDDGKPGNQDYQAVKAKGKGKKGQVVAGYKPFRPKGSRGDISAKATYDEEELLWTLEISRKLKTKDTKNDVQFTDLSKPYFFGLAVWDNDELYNHTRVKKPIKLMFK